MDNGFSVGTDIICAVPNQQGTSDASSTLLKQVEDISRELKQGKRTDAKAGQPGDCQRANESVKDGTSNSFGDAYARNAKGQIDEFQYCDDSSASTQRRLQNGSYKIGHDEGGKVNKIDAPDGRTYVREGNSDIWKVFPKNEPDMKGWIPPKRVRLGDVTVDENGLHASGQDSKALNLPDRPLGFETQFGSKEQREHMVDKLINRFGDGLDDAHKEKLKQALASVMNGDLKSLSGLLLNESPDIKDNLTCQAFKRALDSMGFRVDLAHESYNYSTVGRHGNSITIFAPGSKHGVEVYSASGWNDLTPYTESEVRPVELNQTGQLVPSDSRDESTDKSSKEIADAMVRQFVLTFGRP